MSAADASIPYAVEPAAGTFLARLDREDRYALLRLGAHHSFPRRSVLMYENERDDRMMLLLVGRVKVSRMADNGQAVLLGIRDPGDLLGELAFIDGEPRVATISALERAEALVMSAHSLRERLAGAPHVTLALLELVARRVRETTLNNLRFATADTMARLAARIVELAERYGDCDEPPITIDLPLSQDDLTAWTGASRTGVSQALQAMRRLAWIETGRGRLIVRDVEALRSRSA